jgi:hypothetical protein
MVHDMTDISGTCRRVADPAISYASAIVRAVPRFQMCWVFQLLYQEYLNHKYIQSLVSGTLESYMFSVACDYLKRTPTITLLLLFVGTRWGGGGQGGRRHA